MRTLKYIGLGAVAAARGRDTTTSEVVMRPQITTFPRLCRHCGAPITARRNQWCSRSCYWGDPDCPRRKRRPLIERFWEKVQKTDFCWVWTGPTSSGYGVIGVGGSRAHGAPTVYTHRLSWEIHHGPIADGLHVLHHCDNPPCVNPDHLFLGRHLENVRDMWAKGRAAVQVDPSRAARGERNGAHKLTEEQVREIKQALALGAVKKYLAAQYGVTPRVMTLIARGELWRHVEVTA